MSRTRPMSPEKSSFDVLPSAVSADFRHRRAEDVRGAHKAERQLSCELLQFAEVDRPEKRQALLRFFHGVERQVQDGVC